MSEKEEMESNFWYLSGLLSTSSYDIFLVFLYFAVMLSNCIPISLYVTLDLVKFIGAKFITWDLQLYDEESDNPAICNSSDLNEELGQVEFLFTDKTGTLTDNVMKFQQCSIYGVGYKEHEGQLQQVSGEHLPPEKIEYFLLVLALCNAVELRHIEKDSDASESSLKYVSTSPDEKALVEACARFGVVLQHISGNECHINTKSGIQIFKKLCTLEFTSDRGRMSMIVEDQHGHITLYCKGADNIVLKLSKPHLRYRIEHQINSFSLRGFRALAIAEKKLSRDEYLEFDRKLKAARCLLMDRDTAVSEVFNSIECDFDLIGATAVEDCLQEDVKDTLTALHGAGIKIWVLTGDHHETAFNICLGSGLMNEDTVLLRVLNQHTPEESYFTLTRIQARIAEENLKECALMIDGKSLAFALIDHPDLLGSVAASCASVLCSRLSPLQKAEVVKMVKSMPERPVTAAIGDGANDVSMIQEADVGIGIIGKEGRQAVQCSDFSIAQFKFLKRILLVHGQYYYVRAATLIQYFFYKNLVFSFAQFYFQFYNAFSPQPLYNAMFQMAFNIFYTSLPILVYGCVEKHLPEETLYSNPSIYRKGLKNKLLSVKEFLQWTMFAIWHCTVAFFGTLLLWQGSNIYPAFGMILAKKCYGATVYQVIIFIVNLKLCLHTRFWTYWFIGSVLLSIYSFIGLTWLFTSYIVHPTHATYRVYSYVVKTPQIWLATFLFTVAALIPDIIFLTLCNNASIRERMEKTFLQVYNQITRPCYNLWSILSGRKGDLSSSKISITEEAYKREAQERHL